MRPGSIFFLALLAATTVPAAAKTTVISQSAMSHSTLLGQSTSSAALKTNIAKHQIVLERAAAKLGLSGREYSSLRQQIAGSHYTWVTVPRHLDAMSWSTGQRVHVIRDVMIPAGTNGWEVDVRENNQALALFLPAICGNLSLIRKNMPVVAKAAPPRPVARIAPPPPAPVAPPAQVLGVETAPAPPADTLVGPAVHHANLLPLLLVILPFIGGGGGGSTFHGGGSILPPPPPPPVCGCH